MTMPLSGSRPSPLDRRRRSLKRLGVESLEPRKPLAVTVGLSGTVLSVSFDDTSDDAVIVTITPTGYSTSGADQSTATGTVSRIEVTDAGGEKSSRFTLQSSAQSLTGGLSIDGNIDAAVIGGSIRTEGGPVSIAAKSTTISAAKIDAGVGQQTYGRSVSLQGGSPLGYSLNNLTVVGDTMFFAVGDGAQAGLWKTDGTTAGTMMVKSGPTLSTARNMIDVGGVLVFTASSPATGEELWRSDGTEAGTYMLRDFVPGSGSGFPLTFRSAGYEVASSDQTFSKVVLNNQMFFGLSGRFENEPPYDGSIFWRLWKTDGTVAGTVPVITVPTGNTYGAPGTLAVVGNKMVFTAYSTSSGAELWVSDGTASGTQVLRDINTGSASSIPTNFFPLDANTLLFVANDGTGQELWKTDGTPSGTVRVKEINSSAGSDPSGMTAGPGGVYFSATDGLTGRELWKTDGTPSGTVRLADINSGSGSSNPVGLRAVGSKLYFTATNGTDGYELWKTDGTTSGTSLVKDIRVGSLPTSAWDGPFPLASIGDTLYFTADEGTNGFELWTSDGTANGTALVKDVRTGSGDAFTDSDPIVVAAVGSKLFFRVAVAESWSSATFELWATDGTPTGTSRVLADRVNHFTSFKGEWYLFAGDVNDRLCRLDSTTGAVVLVAEMASITLTGSTVSLGGGVSGKGQSLSIAGAAELTGPFSGLTSLDVSANALVGGSISTTGSQTFSQNLQLTADASLVASHLHFGGTVDGANKRLTLLSTSRSGTPPSAFTNVSVLSVSPPDVRPPQAPTAVQTIFGDKQVSLSWSAPAGDGGSPVTDYHVEMSTNNGSSWTIFQDGVSTATSATVTGLLNGTSYVFRVSAVNVIGSSSPSLPSAATKPAALPGAPQYFTAGTVADAGLGRIWLRWFWPSDGGGSDITDFVIEYRTGNGENWTTVEDGISTSMEAVVPGLLKGSMYDFRVSAVNGVGRGLPTSFIRMAPMATPPDKPTAVVAVPAAESASLSWSPPVYDGMGVLDYVIEYSLDDGSNWSTFVDGTSTNTSATVTGLTNGAGYVFRVSAVNSAGTGSASTASAFVTPMPAVTLAVSTGSVTEDGATNLTYTFTRTGPTTGALTVNYSISGTADGTDYTGATPGTGKTITFAAGSSTATIAVDPTTDTTIESNETVILTLVSGTGYTIGTTTPVTGTITNDDVTVPAAPNNVAGTPGNRQVSLTWTAPTNNGGAAITDYVIQFKTVGATTWSTFNDGTSASTSATVTGLQNGTVYVFRLAARNSSGQSLFSTNSSPVTPRTVPGAPRGVTGKAGNARVNLSWTAPSSNGGSSISDYLIEYSSNSGANWTRFSDGVSTRTSVTVTGLTNGTRYVFRVKAVNAAGEGPWSATSAGITPRR